MHTQRANTTLYFLDMLCMVLAISLIAFSLYVFPYLLGYQKYDVPEFIVTISVWFETHHSLGGFMSVLAILGPFIVAGIAFMFVSRLITIYMETHDYEPGVPHVDQEEYEEHLHKPSATRVKKPHTTLLIIGLMVLIVAALALLEYYLVISIF